jgi:chromosome segregation ATPase
MNLATAITLGISIAGFIGGIIGTVATLSSKYGKLNETVSNNAQRDKEEREKASQKFAELYNRTNAHDASIAQLSGSVQNLNTTCSRIESKLDRLIEGKTR